MRAGVAEVCRRWEAGFLGKAASPGGAAKALKGIIHKNKSTMDYGYSCTMGVFRTRKAVATRDAGLNTCNDDKSRQIAGIIVVEHTAW